MNTYLSLYYIIGSHYCIKVKLLGNCESINIEQYGILLYTNGNDTHDVTINEYALYGLVANNKCGLTPMQTNISLNHPNATSYGNDSTEKCSADLACLNYDKSITEVIPDERFYLSFNNYMLEPMEIFQKGVYQHFMSKFFFFQIFYFSFSSNFSLRRSWWSICITGSHKRHFFYISTN